MVLDTAGLQLLSAEVEAWPLYIVGVMRPDLLRAHGDHPWGRSQERGRERGLGIRLNGVPERKGESK